MTEYLRRKLHNISHPMLGRILMLHRVVEHRSADPEQRELEVTPDFLEQTILDYRRHGYTFISIDELPIFNFQFPVFNSSRFVCLTFDDGYDDTFTTACPILKRLNVPFAVYVATGFIDNQHEMWWYPHLQLGLTTDHLLALDHEPLCTIGAHTVSHPRLDTLPVEEQHKEIVHGKHQLESILGHPVHHFSYPHGAYNVETTDIVKNSGFRSALCAWGGSVRRDADPLLLPRIELKEGI